jgi:ABC-2 type transport system ATP-binding protein
MISVRNLVKCFGERRAVDGISFEVEKGVVLGFLGPNGAGKTTTMRMIAGFIPPTSGTIVVNGFDVVENPVRARGSIGYLPENAPLYEDMTVEEFLKFIAEMRGFRGAERQKKADELIEKCFLGAVRCQPIETLSKGYRQRTCFAQAILHDPPILILDEPTDGLDPNQKQVVRNMIRHMGKEKTIILSTHLLEEVEAICSRVLIISGGKLVAHGTPDELRKQSRYHNMVTLDVTAPRAEAENSLKQVAGVRRVEYIAGEGERHRFRVFPSNGISIAPAILEWAREHRWPVHDLQTHPGRLDDVFLRLTTTADVTAEARKEEEI